MADRFEAAGEKFEELTRLMARLRAPSGCPWDRKQTFESIKSYLLEETYEVMDAIDRRDWAALEDELGDLLLQPVFFAEMAEEEQRFSIADCLERINQKLIRRHPHIFGDAALDTAEDVKRRWDEIKREEKAAAGMEALPSILDEVPTAVPALMESEKLGKKASEQGFDWPEVRGALDKLKEEVGELEQEFDGKNSQNIEHELGDLLFSVVNVARFLKVDAEQALRKANGRFRFRFHEVEKAVETVGGHMSGMGLERLEEFWQAAKKVERFGVEN